MGMTNRWIMHGEGMLPRGIPRIVNIILSLTAKQGRAVRGNVVEVLVMQGSLVEG